jgi:hypothetical protein
MDSWGEVFRDICAGSFWPIFMIAGLCVMLYPRKRTR